MWREQPKAHKVLRFEAALQLLTNAHAREMGDLEIELDKLRERVAAYERSGAAPVIEAVAHAGDDQAARRMSEPNEATGVVTSNAEVQAVPMTTPGSGLTSSRSAGSWVEGSSAFGYLNYMRTQWDRKAPRLSQDAGRMEKFRFFSRRIVDMPFFDAFMGVIILVNSVLIGIEIDLSITKKEEDVVNVLFGVDYVFLAIYILELTFRFLADGPGVLESNWIKFDVVLVAIGCVSAILAIITAASTGEGVAGAIEYLDGIMILRILRLCRMARAVRMMGMWDTLWRLCNGVLKGVETLGSTLVMLVFAVYVFACVGAEFLARDDTLRQNSETKQLIENNFNSLGMIFLTLMQFVLVDGVSEIYMPFIRVQPWLAIYFGALVCFLSILLANLVTAVLVDDAIQNSQMDERMKQAQNKKLFDQMIPKLRVAFGVIDKDGSGQVSQDEFFNANEDLLRHPDLEEVTEILRPEVILELFQHLDTDDSGKITEDELITGLMKLRLAETSLEIAQIKQAVMQQKRSLKDIVKCVERTNILLGDATVIPTPGPVTPAPA